MNRKPLLALRTLPIVLCALGLLAAPLAAQQAAMMRMQHLACHYSPQDGELVLVMMSMSEQTHPQRSFQFRYEMEVVLEVNAEQRVHIENNDLKIAVIGDMVREIDRQYKLFRFSLAMDESSSIDDQSLTQARAAISKFFERLPVAYEAQIIRFTNMPEVLTGFTNDPEVLLAALNRPRASGGTAFYDAIDQALTELQQSGDGVPLQFIVAFTDGQDTTSGRFTDFEQFRRKVDMVTRREQMPIFLAGIGSEVNHQLLEQLAGNMGLYLPLKSLGDLDRLFEAVTNAIEKTYVIGIPISSSLRGVKTVYIKRRTGPGRFDTLQDVPLPLECIP